MPAVRLSDIVGALEMQFGESSSFLDLDTGQVKTVSRDLLLEAEESGDDEALKQIALDWCEEHHIVSE
ncbi:MAG TPA: hypothetical protein VK776_12970 [Bryobacteraceae bacterium]|jgi:hypothetical protein|nr:hypothetical protein [Bryobacteraceae bacterium]